MEIPLFSQNGECVASIRDYASGDVLFENENSYRNVPLYSQIAETLGVCYAFDYIEERLDFIDEFKGLEAAIKGDGK